MAISISIKSKTLDKKEFLAQLTQLESDVHILTRIRKMTNELLSCGAYSDKNIEQQFEKFEKADVPEWEQEIVKHAWKYKKTHSHILLKQLDKLLKDVDINV